MGLENVVTYARSDSFTSGQYKWDAEYDGQHDAAEFLGFFMANDLPEMGLDPPHSCSKWVL